MAKDQLYHVGACFEALCKGFLMATSDFSCNFFCILTSGFEQCAQSTPEWPSHSRNKPAKFKFDTLWRLTLTGILSWRGETEECHIVKQMNRCTATVRFGMLTLKRTNRHRPGLDWSSRNCKSSRPHRITSFVRRLAPALALRLVEDSWNYRYFENLKSNQI